MSRLRACVCAAIAWAATCTAQRDLPPELRDLIEQRVIGVAYWAAWDFNETRIVCKRIIFQRNTLQRKFQPGTNKIGYLLATSIVNG